MLIAAIGLAPPPTLPASALVGPRIWAGWAWFFFLVSLLGTGLTLAFSRGPLLPAQLTFLGLLDVVTGFNVRLWMRPWQLVADDTGIRKMFRGRTRLSVPWDRVSTIRYGVRRRLVMGNPYGAQTYRAAGFIEIRTGSLGETVYADSVYYGVDTKELARLTQYVVQQAVERDIPTAYEGVGILPEEL